MTTTRPSRWPLLMVLTLAALALAVPVGAADETYVIGPEDVLDVQVWDNKDLNAVVFVRPDGKVSLPLAGEVQAGGKTVKQLSEDLAREYARVVRNPTVTIIIREIKSRPVYFIGAFGRPGPLQLTRNDLTLLQALGMIGGVQPTADAEKGFLLRGDRRVPVDFERLLKKGDLSQNVRLEPGDSVVVPLADSVYVQGEVRAPGAVKYTSELTVVKAITQVGGLTPMAASGRVDLLRQEGEKKLRIRVDVDKILRAPQENPDVQLKPNDIIFVPQRLF